jgi:hypothetical protein
VDVQQFRAIVPGDQPQRFLIHDRDSIYAAAVDDAVTAMGLTVLKTPVRCPQANAFCERLIGTIRRECLDWLIVLHERHLRFILREWVIHHNQGRPHTSLGPGIPDVPLDTLARHNRHRIPDGHRVIAAPIASSTVRSVRVRRWYRQTGRVLGRHNGRTQRRWRTMTRPGTTSKSPRDR